MSFERIHLLVGVQNCILLVFHSDAHAWQFRVVSHTDILPTLPLSRIVRGSQLNHPTYLLSSHSIDRGRDVLGR